MNKETLSRLIKSYEAALDLLREAYVNKDVEKLIQERMNKIANRNQWDREVEKFERNMDLYEPLN